MAEPEISYGDAFGQSEQTSSSSSASNQNVPPPVSTPSGKAEINYDDAFGHPQESHAASAQDNMQSIKNIAHAFAEPFAESGDDIGRNLSGPDGGFLIQEMKKHGMFQPYVEDQNDFNKGFLYRTAMPAIHNMIAKSGEVAARGIATGIDVLGLPVAAFNAVSGALGQTAEELPEGPVKELAQYALNSPVLAEVHGTPRVPRTVAESESTGVIGTTEGQNSGIEPLTENQHVKQTVAESEIRPVVRPEPEPVEAGEPNEQNIHTYARALDPETFKQYDNLLDTREDLRKQLSDMQDIAKDKVLDAQESQNYYDLKQKLQEANSQLRDLSPKVSDAYLHAEALQENPESLPNPEFWVEPAPEMKAELAERELPLQNPIADDIEKQLVAAGRSSDEAKASAEVATRMYQYMADVYGGKKGNAQDWYEREKANIVAGKERATVLAQKNKGTELNQNVQKSEKPASENVALEKENSSTLPEHNPNKKPTQSSIDMFAALGKPELSTTPGIGPRGAASSFEKMSTEPIDLQQAARGKIRLATDDANAVITLMKNADASTFLHESAHHFLDMMDRFSKEGEAPEQLKKDMAVIRKWSGLSEKIPETTKEKRAYVQAQEKFARGFERYLMEGVAPTRELAEVFAKFKNWLTSIYKTVFSIPGQRGAINEDVRAFFDHVLSRTPEKTIVAPESSTELAKNIESPKLKDLFGNIQKPPQSLTEFLASKGGLRDEGGDLRAMDADKAHTDLKTGKAKPFINKLLNDGGLSLDDAARQAQEAGYFPEKGDSRPTIEELKAKISDDLGGNKQYSDKDHEALNNHIESLKYNAESDRISHETGIYPEGKTHDQFWGEVEQYYHDQKRYKEAQEIASDTLDDYKELEKKQREFMESRGEAWEAPKTPKSRTLEDIENERKQEQIANDALSGATNTQEPGSAAGASQPGEASIRQGGSGIEPDGRQSTPGGQAEEFAAREAGAREQLNAARTAIADAPIGDTAAPESKPTGSPNEPTGKSEFIDKAGNIRLDLLTDSNSVKAAMREAAEKNPRIFGHEVITDAQVAEFADAMGTDARNLNIQKLREISVNDDIPLAARIRSGSQMMVDALNRSLELMNKENPTDDDVAKFLEAKSQFLMIAETVSATTNEMGRGFRAYNNLMKEYKVTDIHEAAELFQRMTGQNMDQIRSEMKAGSLLKTPKQIAKYTQDSLKPDFWDKLIEYRNNSLLSGPVTHTMYTFGGFANAVNKPLQTLSGVGVQALREALGGEIEQRMYAREAMAQFHALGYGSMRGLKAAMESWKQNSELALPTEITSAPLLNILDQTGLENVPGAKNLGWFPKRSAIEGNLGKVITTSSRAIGSIHSFLKMLNYQQNLAGLAVREALDKGFDPRSSEYEKFVSDLIDNPTSKMMDVAGKGALKDVYREKVEWNTTSGKLFNVVNNAKVAGVPVGKVLFPFIKMQYNIKRLAFRDNSVLGFLDPSVRADVAGLNGDVAKNMALGKIIVGSSIAGLGINMTLQGLNNGSGPSDPKAYKTWRLTHTPYSVQIGSLVIPHKALGTWGQLLGWAGDMAEGAHEFNPEQIEKSAWKFVHKAGAIFTEEGFMTQAKNTLDAAFTPEQFGTRFIQNFATQWLPFSIGFSQTNRLLNDPYSRRVKSEGAENLYGIPEAMMYKYPGTSDLLHVNRDIFGRPVTFESSYDQYANDRVVQKLESLNTGIGRLSDKIKGVQLTEQQYDDYSRIAGQTTYARLSKVVAMPGFDKLPPQHQMNIIDKTIDHCRLLAANTVMKTNPDIMRQAIAKKRMSIYGNKAVNEAEENQTEDVNNP